MTDKHNIECEPQKKCRVHQTVYDQCSEFNIAHVCKRFLCNVLPDLYMKDAPERHVNSTECIMLNISREKFSNILGIHSLVEIGFLNSDQKYMLTNVYGYDDIFQLTFHIM